MRLLLSCVILTLFLCHSVPAFAGEAAPFSDGEVLTYEITWPSGLSLGETSFTARATPTGWNFEARVSANLPTLAISDEYRSSADAEFCSLKLEKKVRHGKRELDETVTYDQTKRLAHRKNRNGEASEVEIQPCTRDALTFLYVLRRELASGRIPPPEDINFGWQYQISMTYAESVEIEAGGEQVMADRMLVDLTGPNSQRSFEVFVGRDKARTPLLMRVPFELGTFSLKLLK